MPVIGVGIDVVDIDRFMQSLERDRVARVATEEEHRAALHVVAGEGVDLLGLGQHRLDVLGHQLSGSGSAYFGVCRNAQHARRLAAYLRTQQLGLVYATRSRA